MSKDNGAAWIPVGERLPAYREDVLALRVDVERYVIVDSLERDSQDGDFWSISGGYAIGDGVTHWMPLPPLPEPAT